MTFEHGLNLFLIGYWINEHTSFMNFDESSKDVLDHWNEVFGIIGLEDDNKETLLLFSVCWEAKPPES
jgi:hypothetical protein